MTAAGTHRTPPADRDAGAPVLEARSLYRFFRRGDEETLALRDVSLRVWAGELVAVTGPSGSGKSTLLACLAGLDEPDGGTVTVAGARMSHRPEAHRARLRAASVGILLQSGNLLDTLTVRQNVLLARQLGRRAGRVPVEDVLDRLGIGGRAGALPRELSGGEAARAGLAVAVANDPSVLLADEPSGELDEVSEARLLELLLQRAQDGGAVVVASHSPALAAAADRVLRLDDGRVAP
jgi:putative ABC transport system ATP-binding protein